MLRGPEQGYSGKYRDDITGQVLNDSLVIEARPKELEFFRSKNVWLKIPKALGRLLCGRPPISVRWVDVNKGDDLEPNIRSRLVARQLKATDASGASYVAPATIITHSAKPGDDEMRRPSAGVGPTFATPRTAELH